MNPLVRFTHRERTVKNYTVNDALQAARAYLRERNLAVCVNSLPVALDEKITLVDLNFISREIIDASLYYDVSL